MKTHRVEAAHPIAASRAVTVETEGDPKEAEASTFFQKSSTIGCSLF
jgi:hypothetical protein